MSEDKKRDDDEGSGGHSSERKRHQDRERLREGADEPLLHREGKDAEEYMEEERSYSLDPDAKPGDDIEDKDTTLDEEGVDPSHRRGERS